MPLDPSDWPTGAQDRAGGTFVTTLTAVLALGSGVFLLSAALVLARFLGFSGSFPFFWL